MSAAGIYVHIPFCRSKCRYCDFVSVCADEEKQRRYVSALIAEINTGRKIYDGEADTLYIGGGTPSCLFEGALKSVSDAVKSVFGDTFAEFTVECNPDSFDENKVEELKSAGVTRVSLGVQSFDDGVLEAIGRRHDSYSAEKALLLAVKSGFDVSADLMLGLPGQTEKDVHDFVGFVSDAGVEHVSAYMLKVEDGTPLASDVKKGLVSPLSDDDCARFYDCAAEALYTCGYNRYETSNFCRNGKRCKHNMKYWTMCDYLGFGPSAHGKIGRYRYFNGDDVDKYVRDVLSGVHGYETEEIMSKDEELGEYIMLGLRLEDGVDVERIEKEFSFDFAEKYGDALEKAKNYVIFDGKRLKIRPEYALVAGAVINMFV